MLFALSPVVPVGRTVWPPLVHLSCLRRRADLEERPQDPVLHWVHPPASLDSRRGDEQEARSRISRASDAKRKSGRWERPLGKNWEVGYTHVFVGTAARRVPLSDMCSSIRRFSASSGSSSRTSSMKRSASSRRMNVSMASPSGKSGERTSSTAIDPDECAA